MDQDATWYGGEARYRTHCVTRDPAPLPKIGTAASLFVDHVYYVYCQVAIIGVVVVVNILGFYTA